MDHDIGKVLAVYAVAAAFTLSFWGFVLYLAWRLVEWLTG
jgi:hypothetical protein